ncbi:MAG: DsbA family protein [Chloroflexi bacterium]|nr:DsbA family protein [Chloroflexota bacterium]
MAERASLVRLEKEFDIEVDWRGFELHPETPEGGVAIQQVFPAGRIKEMRGYLKTFAAGFGIHDMNSPERLPNTRRALAIAEHARDKGRLGEFRAAVMEAHWKKGADIEEDGVLRGLAEAAGLDPEEALAAADAPEYLRRVDEARAEAGRAGIDGVPAFLAGAQRVAGCQRYDMLSGMVVHAGGMRRKK